MKIAQIDNSEDENDMFWYVHKTNRDYEPILTDERYK